MRLQGADLYELTRDDERFFRRAYRRLRIRVPYASPGSDALDGARAEGMSYGLSRQSAKNLLFDLAEQLNWYTYLGTK